MSNLMYLTVKGTKQGNISAGCSTADSIGNKYQENHKDQILVYSLTHGINRRDNVSHGLINIVKPIDKASPLLGVAITNNEGMTVIIDYYRTNNEGRQEKYYTTLLTEASITNIQIDHPHVLTHADNQPQEMISFKYKSITWTHHGAGTSGYSISEERVY